MQEAQEAALQGCGEESGAALAGARVACLLESCLFREARLHAHCTFGRRWGRLRVEQMGADATVPE